MNYIQFFAMRPEVSLLCIYLVIFVYDLISTGHLRRMFHPLVCISTLLLTFLTLTDTSTFTLFGGMYESNAAIVFMKAILAFGTFLTVIQANRWLRSANTSYK